MIADERPNREIIYAKARGGSTVGDAGDASPSTSNVCCFGQTTLMAHFGPRQNMWFRKCNTCTPTWRW